ncbi:unnamed protein product [Meganyctiphanes norvegica]|uniref:Fe2OG dioxygenase domain-containing protein n=1 Tax=Meganyctiphanes norvegica TaxID=48144 RepID=A0AAV2SCJ6_MEGNR
MVGVDVAHLPVIDLRKAKGKERPALARQLHEALTTTGFFYLEGVDDRYNAVELKTLSHWFSNLPLQLKMDISKKTFNKNASHNYRGYFPVQPGEPSHKEGFELGPNNCADQKPPTEFAKFFMESNQWPVDPPGVTGEADKFKKVMMEYNDFLGKAGVELLRLVAEGWPKSTHSEFFTELFTPTHLSTFRLLHYPPRDASPPPCAIDGDYVVQCGGHRDSGFFTLVSTFDYPGLQIQLEDGKWLDVPSRPGAMVVNIGILLSRISGGVLKATTHRVVDFGGHRWSAPYFLEPKFDANVNIKLPPLNKNEESGSTERQNYGKWLFKNLIGYEEYRDLAEKWGNIAQ